MLWWTVMSKLIPLYLVILLGCLAGRKLRARKETVASLLIYAIAPVVIFHGTATARLTPGLLYLPIVFFGIGCVLAVTFYVAGSHLWNDARRNIVAFAAGTGNTGYFGIPVAAAVFGESAMGPAILSTLGIILYENSVGFYLTAKGSFSGRESLKRVLRLPTIYAFGLGLFVNLARVPVPQEYETLATSFRGAYTVLGMIIIGLAVADMKVIEIDFGFIGLAFLAKFLAWPLMMGLVIHLDATAVHLLPSQSHRVLLLMSMVPLAANMVAFATELQAEPEKSALAVLSSTGVALFLIPIGASWFLYGG